MTMHMIEFECWQRGIWIAYCILADEILLDNVDGNNQVILRHGDRWTSYEPCQNVSVR